MALTWHSPYSDTVREMAHDPETNEMLIRWRTNDKTSVYANVSEEEFEAIRKSPSVGSAIRSFIRPAKPHRYG
ncbi:MAG TPA: KTSC domain-containing protein [Candidatus Acidoferrales bacterium]|nr:KTSC domain-containing protein [Candidatus Acidoferrales bacterium]